MSDCLTQLDMILALAEAEYATLLGGDLDAVEQMCAERERLMAEAMSLAAEAPQMELCDRLVRLQSIQQKLRDEAARQREDVRSKLFSSKQEVKRLQGYRKSVNMAMHY